LPPVSPRETEIVLFNWTKQITPDRMIRLSRQGAPEKHVSMEAFLEDARHEQWMMGRHVVDSWFVTVCQQEAALDDPAGKTVRPAGKGETVAEYEMLFSRRPGSHDPMHVYAGYPVRVSLNGIPLRILTTGRDGVLRFLLPADATGTVTLETAPEGSRTLVLGWDLQPVRMRHALDGEQVLVEPKLASGPEDW